MLTDHAPNTFLPTKTPLSRRQARWSEFLQRFELTWQYKPGAINVADPVSRSPTLQLALAALTLASSVRAPSESDALSMLAMHSSLLGPVAAASGAVAPTPDL